MRTCRYYKPAILLLLLLFMTAMAGCSKKGAEQKPQGENTQTETKEPESFAQIVNETDALIMTIGQKVNFVEMPAQQQQQGGQTAAGSQPMQQQGQQDQQQAGQQGQEQGTQQSGQQNQEQQQQNGQQQQQQQQGQQGQQQDQQQQGQQNNRQQSTVQANQQSTNNWTKEQESIKKINQQWNSLEPEAIRAGLNPEIRDKFEKTMEELTMNISDRKAKESLLGAIELYHSYSDMAAVLKSKLPPPYYRVKYEVMMTAALANGLQWDAAQPHASSLTQQWEMLKMKDEGKNSETFTKTEYALTDVKRAVELKQKQLVLIKTEIAMQNLEDLRKKLTDNKGGGQNGGQSSAQQSQ
jgi:hypothetical protein